jgi:arylformamidase
MIFDMTLDLDAEYNNQKRVPEHPGIQARWNKASADYRDRAVAELDLAYGPGARHRYDLFRGAETSAARPPLVVYIHGGYWQRGDKSMYAFIAQTFNAMGIAVAIPTYTLCPAVTVGDIIAELRQCLAVLWRTLGQHPVVVGHSAGGHLAACLLATDWSQVGTDLPPDLVRSAYSLAGVFDLEPLIPTSLNAALGLDTASAHAVSPLYWTPPPPDRTLIAAVGAAESGEFHRQSLAIALAWSNASVKAECVMVPAVNHFTIVDELGKPASAMVARIADLARASAG